MKKNSNILKSVFAHLNGFAINRNGNIRLTSTHRLIKFKQEFLELYYSYYSSSFHFKRVWISSHAHCLCACVWSFDPVQHIGICKNLVKALISFCRPIIFVLKDLSTWITNMGYSIYLFWLQQNISLTHTK